MRLSKERSSVIAIDSNINNDRIPFHQPDFTTSALSNFAARSSACIAACQIICLIKV